MEAKKMPQFCVKVGLSFVVVAHVVNRDTE